MNAAESSDIQSNKRPFGEESPQATPPPRPKRPKTSKACNACRKQKSRCERLAGDAEGCHRCGVIGIPCLFDPEPPSTDISKSRRPRPILPRNERSEPRNGHSPNGRRQESPDNSRLHVLANTTELVSREARTASSHSIPTRPRPQSPHLSMVATPKTPLSPETLSTVESTLFPMPRDLTSESESARFRADWQRWTAPFTLLQKLVRRNAGADDWRQPHCQQDGGLLSMSEESKLKKYFVRKYSPWLPAVRLGKNGTLDDVSPFLSTVIYATASRTFGEISQSTMERLRALALRHVGQIFANPSAYPLVESLYALLILIVWPLDAADDVALLVHGAKRMASGSMPALTTGGAFHPENIDQIRLWYTICANETILTLGAGAIATSPAVDDFIDALGTGSEIALRGGHTIDVLIAMQINLHKIITAAMSYRPFFIDKNSPLIPSTREALATYTSTVGMFLTRLGEWQIEFDTISGECNRTEAAYYAVLEIEYHYLCVMFATHALLTLCHACPLASAPDDIKFTLWSWSITGNKSSHAIIRIFNTYSILDPSSDSHGLPPLALAPDRIFAMVVLAIMLILRHQVASYEYGRRRGLADSPPAGFTKQAENAIRKAVERMGHIGHAKGASTSYDHAAARYVDILEALLRIWEERRARKIAGVASPSLEAHECPMDRYRMRTQEGGPGASSGVGSVGANGNGNGSLAQQMHSTGGGMLQLDMDLSRLGGDLFSDPAATFTWDGLGTLDWTTTGQL